MSRRSATAILTTIVALLALISPVSAKDGFEARLDGPVSIDSEPGTTLSVGWTVSTVAGDKELPMVGSPVFIRLVPRGGGDSVVAAGVERPSGSGHYVAEIRVPAGGIARIEIGLHGESCVQGVCTTSDFLFPMTDDPSVTGATGAAALPVATMPAVQPSAVAAPLDPVAAAAQAVATPAAIDAPWAPLAIVVLLVVAGLTTILVAAAIIHRGQRSVPASGVPSTRSEA